MSHTSASETEAQGTLMSCNRDRSKVRVCLRSIAFNTSFPYRCVTQIPGGRSEHAGFVEPETGKRANVAGMRVEEITGKRQANPSIIYQPSVVVTVD